MPEITSILLSLDDCEVGLVNVFIGYFCLILSKRVLVFSLKYMRAVSTEHQQHDVFADFLPLYNIIGCVPVSVYCF